MNQFDEECLQYFLEHQTQLFKYPVAETQEEAEEFLEDCLAVVCDSLEEVQACLDESGLDVSGMNLDDIAQASEVFSLPSGRFLVVEG